MIVEAAQQAAASMHSGKKYPSKHRSPSVKHLHRVQRDLSAFFGPVAAIIGLLGLVSLLVGSSLTTGRDGVLPEYETDAGDPNNRMLDSEKTYWKLASSMGGFPIKRFYKGDVSLMPKSRSQMLRRVDFLGETVPLYGKGLESADWKFGKGNWLSRRVSRIKGFFGLPGGTWQGHRSLAESDQFAAAVARPGAGGAKEAMMSKLHKLASDIETDAERERAVTASRAWNGLQRFTARPAIVVSHSMPAEILPPAAAPR